MFYKQMIREQGIPVNLRLRDIPNAETVKAITEGRDMLSSDQGGHATADELFDSLGI
jgi:antitoxin component of RelBE/YafQ-DinJ toxin-antitoxin module